MKKITPFLVLLLLGFTVLASAQTRHYLGGKWRFRTYKNAICTITENEDGTLHMVTEKGVPGDGHWLTVDEFIMDFPFAHQLHGTVSEDGRTITWSNTEHWYRIGNISAPALGTYTATRTSEAASIVVVINLKKKGPLYYFEGVWGDPANTNKQAPLSGTYSLKNDRLSGKTKALRGEFPVDGVYDPVHKRFHITINTLEFYLAHQEKQEG